MLDRNKLDEILSNVDNQYIVIDNQEIVIGYEYLEDAFEMISEILNNKGIITDEEKYEFDDLSREMIPSINTDSQDEIDEVLEDLLNRFNILNPYYITKRETLQGGETMENLLEDPITENKLIFTPDKRCSGKKDCKCSNCKKDTTRIKKFKEFRLDTTKNN